MASAGIDSVLTGRSQATDAAMWAPNYLIMGVPPTRAPGAYGRGRPEQPPAVGPGTAPAVGPGTAPAVGPEQHQP